MKRLVQSFPTKVSARNMSMVTDSGAGVGFSAVSVGIKELSPSKVGDTPRSAAPTLHGKSESSNSPRSGKKQPGDFEIEEVSRRGGEFASDHLFDTNKLDSIKVHHRNALRHVSAQEYCEAREEFHRALELDPTNAPALSDLGVLHMMEHDLEMAEVCLTEALSYDPTHAGSRYNLGLLLHTQCQFERAKDQFQLCIDANANHYAAMFSLAQILSFQGNEKAAAELRDRAVCAQQIAVAGH